MPDERIGIGAVIAHLEDDFPDVTISKVRYLEAVGLISPTRTASGYRKFSRADVERLRFVLAAQRDRFWPLRVIRERLDAMDRGLSVDDDGDIAAPPEQAQEHIRLEPPPARSRPLRLTAVELQQGARIDTATFRELISYGLLPKSSEYYGHADLEVARASGALVAAGIDVRHLRPFKSAAERELGLAEHVLGQQALQGRAAGAEGLDDETVARRVVEDCLDLHMALVRRGLQEKE
ncbi:MerR family transcriptional regulator [Janibacter alittae]|uniref:MerR family transcriptional regulator n=1 Tax=Janibacter alittae TaxID=3115209 RepID=A0ABZ2MLN6_9MICO